MSKKGQKKEGKKKLTKKEKKRMNHLKLMQGKKNKFEPTTSKTNDSNKKAA